MNYKDLIYFAKERDLSRRQARYLDMLSKYNIKIIYRPGPSNNKVDILIRISSFKPFELEDERVR